MIVTIERAASGDPPWLHTAISWVLLERTSAGRAPETLRIFRPERILAFGPSDRLSPGYEEARSAARAHGFIPLERLAGGRAAVYHEETIAFAWTVPDPRARAGIRERFEVMSALVAEALCGMGIDARVGAVPGEYCPGDYSVNAGGRTKLMGVGQRVLPGAAHVGGVIVVDAAHAVRDVLLPVNEALGLEWSPATVGSVRNEAPEATWEGVVGSIIDTVGRRFPVQHGEVPPDVVDEARALGSRFGDPAALAGAGSRP